MSTRDKQAEQFAANVLKDAGFPADKQEFTSDLETAFQADWDAAMELLVKTAADSGAGVS